MNTLQLRNSFLLLMTAVIWGIAFVAQSVGMDYVGPFTFNCVRFFIGGAVLIPCIFLLNKLNSAHDARNKQTEFKTKDLCLAGLSCGLVLCLASCFQQFGIIYTTVGKAGFITSFYIIIVPLLGLFFKKRCGYLLWSGVVLALIGLYFLCIKESLSIGLGDMLVFICAFLFSLHILLIDYFIKKADGVKMSCLQFFVCAVISGIAMFIFEEPDIAQIINAWQPILYAGVMSCGVAYTLQIIGQKGMNPTVASLILSLESVIAVLAGFLLLNQQLSLREIIGCIFMFLAIILAQIPEKNERL